MYQKAQHETNLYILPQQHKQPLVEMMHVSNSLSYTVGQIDVFMNGARLAPADFTATNGTLVVLDSYALQVISYK